MRLVVKRSGETVNEFRFSKGPIHIGRHKHSQVFLRDIMVSRQHAVIFATQDGKWIVEDLDSAVAAVVDIDATVGGYREVVGEVKCGLRVVAGTGFAGPAPRTVLTGRGGTDPYPPKGPGSGL